jgi:hypothetical protein
MLDGPNRVAALVFHPHAGLPRPAVGMIASDDSNEAIPSHWSHWVIHVGSGLSAFGALRT